MCVLINGSSDFSDRMSPRSFLYTSHHYRACHQSEKKSAVSETVAGEVSVRIVFLLTSVSNGMTVAGGVPGGVVREGEPAAFTNQFKMCI